MLLTLRKELYGGQWDTMCQDLHDRLEGRPHVFEWAPPDARMRQTLSVHLGLIEQMRRTEAELGVDLCELLNDELGAPS